MTQSILIVEDATELATLLSDYLSQDSYQTHCLHDGEGVVQWVKANRPQLILLDLMLPTKSGLEICKEIRSFSRVPIIMITAKVAEKDRLTGLEMGADDYICKPFSPREVVARVKAVLRRVYEVVEEHEPVQLDYEQLEARINGKPLSLTVLEFHLLDLLVSHPKRVFSRTQLIDKIYPDQRVVSDRTVDSHIKKLRKKIAEVSPEEIIHSVYSAGYKYEIK